MSTLLTAWIAEMVLITYRGAANGGTKDNPIPHLPLPSQYVASFIVYGALSLVPGEGQRAAGLVGWGFVAATFLNLWDPAKPAGTLKPAPPINTQTKAPTSA
jgi:hypothetical protein